MDSLPFTGTDSCLYGAANMDALDHQDTHWPRLDDQVTGCWVTPASPPPPPTHRPPPPAPPWASLPTPHLSQESAPLNGWLQTGVVVGA